MSDGDGSAAAMAAEASGGDAPDPGAALDATDAADATSESDGVGIVEALLHTEPDESPSDYADLPDYTAHGLIGLKKMAHAFGMKGISGGTPAVVNFAQAGRGFYKQLDTGDDDADDAPEVA